MLKPKKAPPDLSFLRIYGEYKKNFQTIEPLFEKHKEENEDIVVLGSGPSLGYIYPKFFENKIIVAVNHTVHYIDKCKALYVIAKEPSEPMQHATKQKGGYLVSTLRKCGTKKSLNTLFYPEITYIFEAQKRAPLNRTQKEALVLSDSTILSGVHLAAFMGAQNIMLIGHDCGTLDENIHVPKYDKNGAQTSENRYASWMNTRNVESQTLSFKKLLREEWGIHIYSLNPFINFGLEGHTYQPFNANLST